MSFLVFVGLIISWPKYGCYKRSFNLMIECVYTVCFSRDLRIEHERALNVYGMYGMQENDSTSILNTAQSINH